MQKILIRIGCEFSPLPQSSVVDKGIYKTRTALHSLPEQGSTGSGPSAWGGGVWDACPSRVWGAGHCEPPAAELCRVLLGRGWGGWVADEEEHTLSSVSLHLKMQQCFTWALHGCCTGELLLRRALESQAKWMPASTAHGRCRAENGRSHSQCQESCQQYQGSNDCNLNRSTYENTGNKPLGV